MKETNTKLNTILVKLTDITGFDHTPLALEAFAVAETDIKLLIQEAVAEEKERLREWLKAEKATYSEDVAQRERTVYDHIIKCFGEYSLNKAKEDLLKREPLMSKGEMERTIRNINSSNKDI